MKRLIPFLLLFLFFPAVSAQDAQDNIFLIIEGEGGCRYFNVTISSPGIGEGCYDVKVDLTTENGRIGEIYDPREGWKSSYYYVDDVCIGEGENIMVQMRATSNDKILNFRATLKSGSSEWQSGYYVAGQSCPADSLGEDIPIEYFLLPILLSIMVILIGLAAYKKWG